MTRLLYLLPGLVPPPEEPARDKFTFLSEIAEGVVLLPVWWSSKQEVSSFLRAEFPVHRVGRFSYFLRLAFRPSKVLRKFDVFFFYLSQGLRSHRERRIDVIVSYGTNLPGIAAVLLKWMTGAMLIAEIPGVPENAFRFDRPNPSVGAGIKRFIADSILRGVGSVADCFKLLYPDQLKRYPGLFKKRTAVFHDFVPVRMAVSETAGEQFILSVGHPWYTKGNDILIRSFKRLAPKYPNIKLKLLGYFPDPEPLKRLAEGCSQIELMTARPNELALKVIGGCTIFALASRSEAMGRVLLEAMAAGKPIVAAAVGGVPYYIRDGENGLLFAAQDVDQLTERLKELLEDEEMRKRLSREAHRCVFANYDELSYSRSFDKMLRSLNNGS